MTGIILAHGAAIKQATFDSATVAFYEIKDVYAALSIFCEK